MKHGAVFLDRDDTLVVDSGFIDDPDKVALVPGAAEAVRRLKRAGFKVVVVTNQSGIARGYFDEPRLQAIHDRLQDLLRACGTQLDGIYYCPFLEGPQATVEAYRKKSERRKPAPGMLLQAAGEMNLDLSRSWMIGDSARDIQAGRAAGCRTILISDGATEADGDGVDPDAGARSLIEAAEIVEQDTKTKAVSNTRHSPKNESDTNALLIEIRDLLERKQREHRQEDFSLMRLAGTLAQMLAIFVALWGVLAMLDEDVTTALTRFALAGFLQLAIIALLLSNRRR